MADSGPQLHINVEAPSQEKMEPLSQGAKEPEGGIWTSTPNNEKDSMVVLEFASMDPDIVPGFNPANRPNWQRRKATGENYYCYLLYPSEKARIATIDTRRDLVRLGIKYQWVGSISHPFNAPPILVPLLGELHWTLNFLNIAKDYDALRVTEHAVQELKTEDPAWPGSATMDEYRLPAWNVESTCWFRWCFERVEELGMLRDYMKIPPWLFRKEMLKQRAALDAGV